MDNTEELIVFSIDKISQINRMLLWNISKKNHLSPIQIQFIDFINKAQKEYRTISNIAKEFELKKATVSDSVKKLIEKGYLEKNYNSKDKRIFYLKATKKSNKELNMLNEKNQILIEAIKTFTNTQKELVTNFFMNLLKNLYDKKIIHNAHICLTCVNFSYKVKDHKNYYCKYLDSYFSDKEINNNCIAYMQK